MKGNVKWKLHFGQTLYVRASSSLLTAALHTGHSFLVLDPFAALTTLAIHLRSVHSFVQAGHSAVSKRVIHYIMDRLVKSTRIMQSQAWIPRSPNGSCSFAFPQNAPHSELSTSCGCSQRCLSYVSEQWLVDKKSVLGRRQPVLDSSIYMMVYSSEVHNVDFD